MLTSERMAVVDRNAMALGVPPEQLMENAGSALAREAGRDEPDDVLVLAGTGNNGGDALVASRFLESEAGVTTVLLGRASNIRTDEARANWEALEASDASLVELRDSTGFEDIDFDADVVVDGVLGVGVTGALREPVASAVEHVNDSDTRVVSADVPTGVNPDAEETSGDFVEADSVVAFHDVKPVHPSLGARVVVADIGIPDASEEFVGEGDLTLLRRDPTSHKGDHGKVVVVGGGPYTGAPALTALAALRAGADLAKVVAPETAAETVASFSPDLITRPLEGDLLKPEHVEDVADEAEDADVTVVGPGLGADEGTLRAVRELLPRLDHAVVDADALREIDAVSDDAEIIATPHAGELARHVDEVPEDWRERRGVVRDFARDKGIVTLLKGHYDVVSDGEKTRVSRTGNPGMTVGGTGDVLAGVCASLSARLGAFDAACIGVFANGRAGDAVVEERGYGMTATDLVEAVPGALKTK
ncbi:MAG: NAD(P)H-hydrate dehydratase [Halobacteriales archaeon]|nr:NAD(P)H-hydrate dehydratase [Halobacteriales archaeon]